MPLLKGLDGKEKMSKSLKNTIGLTDTPNEMFGKTMSIPDTLINEFIDLTTDFSVEEKENLKLRIKDGENPMYIKKLIAKNIITQYHDPESAEQAEMFFTNQFQNKNDDEKVFEPVSLNSLNNRQESMTLSELCH